MSDIARTLTEAIKTEIATELGATWRELAYVQDTERNSFRQGNGAYGVRALASSQIDGVTRYLTFTQTFEVLLTEVFGNERVGDSVSTEKALDLFEALYSVHARLVANRCGSPANVLNVTGLTIADPVFDNEQKTVTVRATLDVTFRILI